MYYIFFLFLDKLFFKVVKKAELVYNKSSISIKPMKKFDCLTIGSATQDIMFYTDEAVILKNPKDIIRQKLIAFKYGAKVSAQSIYFTLGGGAQNAAVAMSKLGLKVGILTAVGSDGIAEEIKANLKRYKIDASLLKVYRGHRSSFSFIVNTGKLKEHVIFTYRGANFVVKFSPADLAKIKADWFYLTSLSGDYWRSNLRTVFAAAEKKKVKMAWNPGSSQLKAGYKNLARFIKHTQVFNVNKDEAIELVLSYGKKVTNIQKLLFIIKSWGPEIVVITDGPKGAYVFDGKKIYYHPALTIKGINTTGAGDSFGSTFVWGLIKFKDLNLALKAAIINSNNVITAIGAQVGLLTDKQIKKLIKS